MSKIFIKDSGNGTEVANNGEQFSVARYTVGGDKCLSMNDSTAGPSYVLITKVGDTYHGDIRASIRYNNTVNLSAQDGTTVTVNIQHPLLGRSADRPYPTVTTFTGPTAYIDDYFICGVIGYSDTSFGGIYFNTVYGDHYGQPGVTCRGNMQLNETDSATLATHFGVALPA